MGCLQTTLKRLYPGLLLGVMSLWFFPTELRADNTIRWARLDFPPFEINDGPLANTGIVDRVRQMMQHALAQYQHFDAGRMNQARLLTGFKKSNLCHAALLRSPLTEKTTYLSVGVGIMPSQAIITTQETYAAQFPQQLRVSLQQMLTREDLVFGLFPGSVGPNLDTIIAQHAQKKNVYVRKASEIAGLFNMLAKKRIDYTLGYPAEALFWNAQHPEYHLVVVPLEETAGQYAIGRVVCTKNEWGRAVITQVNEILFAQRMQATYIRDVFLPWIPEAMHADYLRDYQRMLSEDTWTNVNEPDENTK